MAKQIKRPCENCGEELRGRSDQRFCSDQCRVAFHNYQNRDSTKFMTNVSNILRKNKRILESMNPGGKTVKVTKTQLLDEGFKFSYFTNEYVTKAKKVYRFCFDQGYIEIEPELYTLVVRQKYVD